MILIKIACPIIYQGVLCRIHKANFPIQPTSIPTNLLLLMLYLGNINFQLNNKHNSDFEPNSKYNSL
jgi:hypothetical protein